MLFYLKDKSREQAALEQIQVLERLRNEGKRFYPESRIAAAYVAAGTRDFNKVREILSNDRAQFDSELKGAWRQLYQDLKFQVMGNPPNGGSRPGEPPPRNTPPGGQP